MAKKNSAKAKTVKPTDVETKPVDGDVNTQDVKPVDPTPTVNENNDSSDPALTEATTPHTEPEVPEASKEIEDAKELNEKTLAQTSEPAQRIDGVVAPTEKSDEELERMRAEALANGGTLPRQPELNPDPATLPTFHSSVSNIKGA